MRLPIALLLLALPAFAQPPDHQPDGTVTGRVTCADTQRPARLAQVKLVRVPTPADAKSAPKDSFNDAAPSGNAVETSLDGTYTLRNVKPGAYYLVVDKDGYLLPLEAFSLQDLASTDTTIRTRIANAAQILTVQDAQTTHEDVVLERGASVSGTVTYDDGSPAAGIGIKLLVKDEDGKWTPSHFNRYRQPHSFDVTDDNGFYRLTGLPAGEYATEADLTLNDHEQTTGPMPSDPKVTVTFALSRTRFSLPLYSGDVLHKPEAKPYTLGTGEARPGSDLVFPLAKLHKVGGQVLAHDGHPVNAGDIQLLYPDDHTTMASTSIQFEDSAFQLDYVPEGEFLLQIKAPKDVARVQVENPVGYTPRFREDTKIVATYPDSEQPLTVKGDTSDITAQLPEPSKSLKPTNPTP